jgi:hypothetical protein
MKCGFFAENTHFPDDIFQKNTINGMWLAELFREGKIREDK